MYLEKIRTVCASLGIILQFLTAMVQLTILKHLTTIEGVSSTETFIFTAIIILFIFASMVGAFILMLDFRGKNE
jgi:quinol-cytochrome oxidoreductase complex cytochrome b subunit